MKNLEPIYSINFDRVARSSKKITYLIYHYTGMKSESKAIERLLNKKSKVSCHYFIKKNGFISVDVDFINYTTAFIQSADFDSYRDNQEIKNIYKSLAVNYRFGLEGRYDNFYIRAGYNYLTDPNRIKGITDNSLAKKSLGFGYLAKNLSIDLTYSILNSKSNITPYPIFSDQPFAEFSTKNKEISITLGVRINNR